MLKTINIEVEILSFYELSQFKNAVKQDHLCQNNLYFTLHKLYLMVWFLFWDPLLSQALSWKARGR